MSDGAFAFEPPQRRQNVPDAGLPAFRYNPALGKKSQIYNDEIGRVSSNVAVSVGSPDFMQVGLEHQSECIRAFVTDVKETTNRVTRERKDPNSERPRAAGLTCVEKHKAAQWRTHDPGRANTQAMCSQQSPRWFKCPIENNKGLFEGVARDLNCTTDSYNFEPSREQEKQAHVEHIKHVMKHHQGNKGCFCSLASPDWMKISFESNKDTFKELGVPMHRRPSAESDCYRDYPIEKKSVLIVNELGEKKHPLVVSKTGPRWMKSPFLGNREYFEKMTGRPLKEPDFVNTGFREKVGAKTARRNMVSVEAAPHWMKSSVMLNPRDHPHQEIAVDRSRKRINREVHRSEVHKALLQGIVSPMETTEKRPSTSSKAASGARPASQTGSRNSGGPRSGGQRSGGQRSGGQLSGGQRKQR